MNVQLLNYKIKASGVSISEFYSSIGMSATMYYKRRNNPACWRLDEIKLIKNVLNLTNEELMQIFFD